MPDDALRTTAAPDLQTGAPALQPASPTLPRDFPRFLSLDDFDRVARRWLPRMIYGYVAGTVETGAAQANARAAYADLQLVPRTLRDVSRRDQACELLGQTYAHPFGIAPLGGAAMVAYRGDLVLADAAQAANVPMVMSASSLIPLEEVARGRPNAWFQAYLAGDQGRIDALVDRVAAAGFGTLVVTADTPIAGNRENNLRNGFSMPLKVSPRVVLDAALHPRWLLGVIARTYLHHGTPHFENMDATRGPPMMSQKAVRTMTSRDQLAWKHIEAIRRRWAGKLVVKGLLAAGDAARARDAGCDAIIVSSHGGRQLDHALAPAAALPDMVAAAGPMPVMVDGGIRRGTDVLKALALGARFVFLGRPFLYAAFLAGVPGVAHAINILSTEIDRDMALMGLRNLSELDGSWVRPR